MFQNKKQIAFVIYAICLLALPAKMVWDQQKVFGQGTEYRFRCQPMDPNDPFRGKYVRLGFERITFPHGGDQSNQSYGIVSKDDAGYAYISDVVSDKADGRPKVELNLQYRGDSIATYTLPFDRLYMNEFKAKAAEDQYRNALRDTTDIVYAKVFISDGRFLLDNVYINDTPLEDAIEEKE